MHTKCDHPANFLTSLELWLLSLLTDQIMSLLTSCHIRQVCLHYKSIYFQLTCPVRCRNFWRWIAPTSSQRTSGHQTHQTSTHSTTMCGISQTSVKAKDHPRAKMYTAAYLGWLATEAQTTINKVINNFCKLWTYAFWPIVDTLSILCELPVRTLNMA